MTREEYTQNMVLSWMRERNDIVRECRLTAATKARGRGTATYRERETENEIRNTLGRTF